MKPLTNEQYSALKAFIDRIEKIAFEMRAPNQYTPRFVEKCVSARAMVDEWQASRAALEDKWISVEDRLPPPVNEIDFDSGTTYAVLKRHRQSGVLRKDTCDWVPDTGHEWSWIGNSAHGWFVAYWMPLPPAPKE